MSGTGLLLALGSRTAAVSTRSATTAAAAAAVATPGALANAADSGPTSSGADAPNATSSSSSSSSSNSSSSTTSSRGRRGQQAQQHQAPRAAAPAAAGPGPGSTRLFAHLAAAPTAAAEAPALGGWHQRQAAAAYRAPIKGKQGGQTKGGSGGGKGGGSAAAAGASDTGGAASASAAAFDDGGPGAGDAVRVVLQAVGNVTPHLDVRTIRSATKTTYVPGVMPPDKGRSLALHWLVAAAEARKKSSAAPFAECLALELLLAYQKRGAARQKRDDLHKLALQNRANLHMRWW